MYRVTLDAGHGGYDSGAVYGGVKEKDLTMQIVRKLYPRLVQRGIATAVTRMGDYAPGNFEYDLDRELRERVRLSDAYVSDLFVSVHINAGGGTGSEVLISGIGGNAERGAKLIKGNLSLAGCWPDRGIKVQNVLVLRETDCPAYMTENGFIDNENDFRKLTNPFIIESIAIAHYCGICEFFGLTY